MSRLMALCLLYWLQHCHNSSSFGTKRLGEFYLPWYGSLKPFRSVAFTLNFIVAQTVSPTYYGKRAHGFRLSRILMWCCTISLFFNSSMLTIFQAAPTNSLVDAVLKRRRLQTCLQTQPFLPVARTTVAFTETLVVFWSIFLLLGARFFFTPRGSYMVRLASPRQERLKNTKASARFSLFVVSHWQSWLHTTWTNFDATWAALFAQTRS